MKKIAIFILAFILCLPMTSCDSTEPVVEKEPPEIVDLSELMSDLDNQARATLNVGKATTMFGSISNIAVDHCTINHTFRSNSSTVYMETEVLAELSKGQFVAIYGVVESVEPADNGNDYRYVFVDGRLEDMVLFDEYVSDYNYGYSWCDNDDIYERAEFLYNYATSRGDALRLKEDELKSFLVGNWERKTVQRFLNSIGKESFTGEHTPEITFFENGTYKTEHFGNHTSKSDFHSSNYDIDSGEWFIEDGRFKIDRYIPSSLVYVYKISPNVFICDGDELFIRCEPNEDLQ